MEQIGVLLTHNMTVIIPAKLEGDLLTLDCNVRSRIHIEFNWIRR